MIDRTATQIADLIERQEAHEARLRVLMLQAAQRGSNTPPEIIVEVRSIQQEVLQIATQITKLQIHASKADQRQYIAEGTHDLADVSLQLSSSTETIRRFQQDMFVQLLRFFDSDTESRRRRQRITNWFYASVLVMLAIDIGIRLFR
jgi:hypothetical protein